MFRRVTRIRWPDTVEQQATVLNSGLSGHRAGTQQASLQNLRTTKSNNYKRTYNEDLPNKIVHGTVTIAARQVSREGSSIGLQCPSFLLRLHLLLLLSSPSLCSLSLLLSFLFRRQSFNNNKVWSPFFIQILFYSSLPWLVTTEYINSIIFFPTYIF